MIKQFHWIDFLIDNIDTYKLFMISTLFFWSIKCTYRKKKYMFNELFETAARHEQTF